MLLRYPRCIGLCPTVGYTSDEYVEIYQLFLALVDLAKAAA